MEFLDVNLDEVASAFHETKNFGKRCKEAPSNMVETKRYRKKFPKFQTYVVSTGGGCIHEVVYPSGYSLNELKYVENAARHYPFALDPFQQRAILCIENEQSVMVSAHTSAGKTVVAEYAVAKSLKQKQRVIYTTPIKALSNQKFREFSEIFKDVGLMTGDITINQEATVLIMTTEILRSMLYRSSDVTREVGWVIFDEIHYMREKERGVIWEETIILLPDSVGLVFLSATIPNAREFAEWIVFLHRKPCHVVYTDCRPVPLQHYVFPCGGDGIHLVVNQNREFIESNFNAALDVLQNAAGSSVSDVKSRGRNGGNTRSQPYCSKLVKLVMDQNLEPLIVFSFSKMHCEYYAMQLNKMNFSTESEKAAIDLVFNNAIESLSVEDRNLPQVQILLPVLRRGIGIHHGGLLPILKEIVEVLFSEGFIKVLYATETFAMGLNMPARTVLFTSTRKFDGRDARLITSGEYIQMSGRAGRRGKDTRGTVIMMLDDRISPDEARRLLLGEPDRLDSSFYLTNNMILNLLRVEDINPEVMLLKNFHQFQCRSELPSLKRRLKDIESLISNICFPNNVDMEQLGAYVKLHQAVTVCESERWALVSQRKCIIPFFQAGRVVRIRNLDDWDFGWGIVLHVSRFNSSTTHSVHHKSNGMSVVCLMQVAKDHIQINPVSTKKPIPLSFVKPVDGDGDSGTIISTSVVHLVTVPLDYISGISSVCLKMNALLECDCQNTELLCNKLLVQPDHVKRRIWDSIDRAKTKLGGVLPILDPVKDLNIQDNRVKKQCETINLLKARMAMNPISKRTDLDSLIERFNWKATNLRKLEIIRQRIDRTDSLSQFEELRARKRLLRRLYFCSEDDTIALKGRIACEISSGDELMLTELLLDGFFSQFSPAQLAGVMSCFVAEKQTKYSRSSLSPVMKKAIRNIHEKARYIAKMSAECNIVSEHYMPTSNEENQPITFVQNAGNHFLNDEQAYVDRFIGDLMDVVCAWAEGASFARLCELTNTFEGSIIRCIRRLEELLRQMHNAAKVAGNSELENKFLEGRYLHPLCNVA
ncbi:Superkiller viralicidic activity 2-like 2 isoform 3 [Schistosoma japonicum]|uniref:Superkiller viralicidic activity 2-like 2 isoform 3 n=2 Tax=Schistosoma japonicum TaxID=6182 RepID=A0A4Z2CPU1_SCHJA|nr:Superkiller viralicidic activity 2-like 2 isoform 3 [Schistosoma japonicum]TNN06248.1 Superkiller viralicidic activity 2-like 2 isoform 3 [Schistosoma japonicum]